MTIADERFWTSLVFGIFTGMFLVAVAPNLFRLFFSHHDDATLPRSVNELIACYIYGTLAILIGGGVAVWLLGIGWVVLVFLAVAAGCGLVVVLRYVSVDIARNKLQNALQRKNNPDLNDD